MRFNEYCDAVNAQLEVIRYPNQGERWTAKFYHCEVKEGGFLAGAYGNGITPEEAIADYLKKIEGKRIVFDAMSEKYRREFVVPLGIVL